MNRLLYTWTILGVVAFIGKAIVRLAQIAAEPILQGDLTTIHWIAAAPWLGFMVWTEGVKGFHHRFSPRVVQRAAVIHRAPWWVQVLAPAAGMGLLWATRRRVIASWALLLGIVGLVLLVRGLPPEWRAVVDLGVVAGLGTGTASLLWHAARGWNGTLPDIDPDLPSERNATPA